MIPEFESVQPILSILDIGGGTLLSSLNRLANPKSRVTLMDMDPEKTESLAKSLLNGDLTSEQVIRSIINQGHFFLNDCFNESAVYLEQAASLLRDMPDPLCRLRILSPYDQTSIGFFNQVMCYFPSPTDMSPDIVLDQYNNNLLKGGSVEVLTENVDWLIYLLDRLNETNLRRVCNYSVYEGVKTYPLSMYEILFRKRDSDIYRITLSK